MLPALIGLGAAGLGLSAISSGINYYNSSRQNAINNQLTKEQFAYQKEADQRNFNYQKQLNEQIMAREDNAVQRRAADLKAAGMSKNLAAGSSAQASSLSGSNGNIGYSSPVSPAQLDTSGMVSSINGIANNLSTAYLSTSQKKLNDAKAIVELKNAGLVDAQTAKTWAEKNYIAGVQTEKAVADKNLAESQTASNQHDLELSQQHGIKTGEKVTPSNPSEIAWRGATRAGKTSAVKDMINDYIDVGLSSGKPFGAEQFYDGLDDFIKESYSKKEIFDMFQSIARKRFGRGQSVDKTSGKTKGNQIVDAIFGR